MLRKYVTVPDTCVEYGHHTARTGTAGCPTAVITVLRHSLGIWGLKLPIQDRAGSDDCTSQASSSHRDIMDIIVISERKLLEASPGTRQCISTN